MKWDIGGYVVNINPVEYSRENKSQVDPLMTANGTVSTANTTYETSQSFSLEIFKQKTSYKKLSYQLSAGYKSLAVSKSGLGNHYLLKGNTSIDKITYGGIITPLTITASATGVIGSGTLLSITHSGSEIIALYQVKQGNVVTSIEVTAIDDNGKTIRKYIYSSTSFPDLMNITDIAFHDGQVIHALDSYGRVFNIDFVSGQQYLLFSTPDYLENKEKNQSKYKGVSSYIKLDNYYVALLLANGDIQYYTLSGDGMATAKTNIYNVKGISFDSFRKETFFLMERSILNINENTVSIDIEVIKDKLEKGMITVTDEDGMQLRMVIEDFKVERIRYLDEARYRIDLSGRVIDIPQGFNK